MPSNRPQTSTSLPRRVAAAPPSRSMSGSGRRGRKLSPEAAKKQKLRKELVSSETTLRGMMIKEQDEEFLTFEAQLAVETPIVKDKLIARLENDLLRLREECNQQIEKANGKLEALFKAVEKFKNDTMPPEGAGSDQEAVRFPHHLSFRSSSKGGNKSAAVNNDLSSVEAAPSMVANLSSSFSGFTLSPFGLYIGPNGLQTSVVPLSYPSNFEELFQVSQELFSHVGEVLETRTKELKEARDRISQMEFVVTAKTHTEAATDSILRQTLLHTSNEVGQAVEVVRHIGAQCIERQVAMEKRLMSALQEVIQSSAEICYDEKHRYNVYSEQREMSNNFISKMKQNKIEQNKILRDLKMEILKLTKEELKKNVEFRLEKVAATTTSAGGGAGNLPQRQIEELHSLSPRELLQLVLMSSYHPPAAEVIAATLDEYIFLKDELPEQRRMASAIAKVCTENGGHLFHNKAAVGNQHSQNEEPRVVGKKEEVLLLLESSGENRMETQEEEMGLDISQIPASVMRPRHPEKFTVGGVDIPRELQLSPIATPYHQQVQDMKNAIGSAVHGIMRGEASMEDLQQIQSKVVLKGAPACQHSPATLLYSKKQRELLERLAPH